jgi:hypothetical protein
MHTPLIVTLVSFKQKRQWFAVPTEEHQQHALCYKHLMQRLSLPLMHHSISAGKGMVHLAQYARLQCSLRAS